MSIEQACEFSKKLVRESAFKHDVFENYTKGKIIRILSEKFIEKNKEDLAASNIVSILFETFDGFISKRTIWQNISEKLKNPVKASAGRKGGKSKVVEKDTVSIENEDGSMMEIENPDPPLPNEDHEDIDDDESARPYSPDAKRFPKIVKLDKQKGIELDNALKASISCIYLVIDPYTDEVTGIYTDKKYDRVIIPTKAKTR